ncbi:MAG: hypothetical protein ACI35V_12805 [Sphingobacterium composti]
MELTKNVKAKYKSPKISCFTILIEECIASGSNNAVTIGGPENSAYPEIEDAIVDNKTFDITF